MSGVARAGLIALGVVVAAAAFVVLRPSDEAERTETAAETAAPPAAPGTGRQSPSKPAAPKPTEITVADGEPVGGVKKIEVDSGERIRMMVQSDVADEVHVHGYDRSAEVSPGSPARISFPARLEGIYEVELENAGLEIAQLQVNP
jgi:hypothetical protein